MIFSIENDVVEKAILPLKVSKIKHSDAIPLE